MERVSMGHNKFRCLLHIGKSSTFHVSREPTPFHGCKSSTFHISITPLHFLNSNIPHDCMLAKWKILLDNKISITIFLNNQLLRLTPSNKIDL